jgi:SAM-dependent methyltransferase/uncharacterized protein YbaR (Trm112 family)
MQRTTVTVLKCPDCGTSGLTIADVFAERDSEIVHGSLTCTACARWFPIVDRILILSPLALRGRSEEERLIRATGNVKFVAQFQELGPGNERDSARVENHEMSFWNEEKWLEEPRKNWFRTLGRQEHLFAKIDYSRPSAVLELGAGFATDMFEIADRLKSGTKWIATDLSYNALASIRDRFAKVGNTNVRLDLVVCVAGDAPFNDAEFDYVIALGILHHTPEMHAAVPSIARKLRTGGKLLLMEPKERKSMLGRIFRRTFPFLGLKESEHEERIDFDKLEVELRNVGTIESFHGETSPIVPLIALTAVNAPFTETGARLLQWVDQAMIATVGRVFSTFSYGEGLFVVEKTSNYNNQSV